MNSLFESPVTIFMVGLLFVGMTSAAAFMLKQRRLWQIAIGIGVLTIGLVIVERLVVTDRESLRSTVFQLATAVENNDVDGVVELISTTYPGVNARARSEMRSYEFANCQVSGFREIKFFYGESPVKADVEVVVWVSGKAIRGDRIEGTGPRAIMLNFIQEDGQWRFYDYRHYQPGNRVL